MFLGRTGYGDVGIECRAGAFRSRRYRNFIDVGRQAFEAVRGVGESVGHACRSKKDPAVQMHAFSQSLHRFGFFFSLKPKGGVLQASGRSQRFCSWRGKGDQE